jgi:glycerol-3-phosphate dehydrogenase
VAKVDLIVVGGGISGLGVALAAGAQGKSCMVLERDQICAATSANSLRIIHGGFRYLQQMNFPRVLQSIRDQSRVLEMAPQFTQELECVMPLERFGLRSKPFVKVALLLYQSLVRIAGGTQRPGYVAESADVEQRVPVLKGNCSYGALCWHDVLLTNQEAFAKFLVERAKMTNCQVLEHACVERIELGQNDYQVLLADGRSFSASAVVNTCGPQLQTGFEKPHAAPDQFQWCKGYNIVLSKQVDARYAIGLRSKADRLLFLVPRGNGTALGTWYVPTDLHNAVEVSERELASAIAEANETLPTLELSINDIEAVDCGVLPMKRSAASGPILYGSEKIFSSEKYIEVLSTKYTTFLSQGERVVRALS